MDANSNSAEKEPQIPSILTEGILLLFFTAVAYLATYQWLVGYLWYFFIPSQFAEVTTPDIIRVGVIVWALVAFFGYLLYILSALPFNYFLRTSEVVFTFLPLILAILLAILIRTRFGFNWWFVGFSFLVLLMFALESASLLIHIKGGEKISKYIKVQTIYRREYMKRSMRIKGAKNFPKSLNLIFMIGLISLIIGQPIGIQFAKIQTIFATVLVNEKQYLLIYKNDSNMFFSNYLEVDRNDSTYFVLTGEIAIYPIESIEVQNLVMKKYSGTMNALDEQRPKKPDFRDFCASNNLKFCART